MNDTQKLVILGGLVSLLGWLSLTESGKQTAQSIGATISGGIMNLSESGLNLIKQFEGFSATPYPDANGWSIGYGHYMGNTATIQSVTPDEAISLLNQDTANAQSTISRNVKVPLSQNQFDALTSLIYNIGAGNFTRSTLLRVLNGGDYQGAADQFLVWNKSQQGGALKENPALTARREAERQIFLS